MITSSLKNELCHIYHDLKKNCIGDDIILKCVSFFRCLNANSCSQDPIELCKEMRPPLKIHEVTSVKQRTGRILEVDIFSGSFKRGVLFYSTQL